MAVWPSLKQRAAYTGDQTPGTTHAEHKFKASGVSVNYGPALDPVQLLTEEPTGLPIQTTFRPAPAANNLPFIHRSSYFAGALALRYTDARPSQSIGI